MNKEQEIVELRQFRRDGLPVCTMVKARKILQAYPKEFSVLIILGTTLSTLGKFDEAIEVIDEAIQVIDKAIEVTSIIQHYRAYTAMAIIFFEKGLFSEAEKWYEKAFNIQDPQPIDQVIYAECLMKNGEFSKAIQLLKESIEASSNPKESAYYELGVAYRAIGTYDDALANFQKAVSIDPNYDIAKEAVIDILKYKESMERSTMLSLVR